MPVHLRWELYPVAHEKGRPYGGSYLEEIEWWHRPRRINLFGEFSTFMGELLLFKEYFKRKRGFGILFILFILGSFYYWPGLCFSLLARFLPCSPFK